ncbi:ElaB/YqjD/DUF883 family membrane-anchored ribosome-binding protein [Spirosoma lacussanchae]|uniref:hypothetical protein n=1 Tax=Spirosoma lacussanchae TaxID=1884249 RepID=UPI00148748A5|nr:hypothetical protein [Spirosoma lacussanchae]
MTSADKQQQAQQLATEGQQLISQAETLLKRVVLRNTHLSQELRQVRLELEEKLASQKK